MQITQKNGLLQEVLDSGYSTPPGKLSEILLNLSSLAKDLQKDGRTRDLTGVAVWLHTLRCFAHRDFIDYGRAMWTEMSRGIDYVGSALDGLEELTGNPIPNRQLIIENSKYVPNDLKA
jgi:hypothetical protein